MRLVWLGPEGGVGTKGGERPEKLTWRPTVAKHESKLRHEAGNGDLKAAKTWSLSAGPRDIS